MQTPPEHPLWLHVSNSAPEAVAHSSSCLLHMHREVRLIPQPALTSLSTSQTLSLHQLSPLKYTVYSSMSDLLEGSHSRLELERGKLSYFSACMSQLGYASIHRNSSTILLACFYHITIFFKL